MNQTRYKTDWVIWKFDGAYDIHYAPNGAKDFTLQPEIEGLSTIAEAKQWIDKYEAAERFFANPFAR